MYLFVYLSIYFYFFVELVTHVLKEDTKGPYYASVFVRVIELATVTKRGEEEEEEEEGVEEETE